MAINEDEEHEEHLHRCDGEGCHGEWWKHSNEDCERIPSSLSSPRWTIMDCPMCDGNPNGDMVKFDYQAVPEDAPEKED